MTYEERKKELLSEKTKLLTKYNALFNETMELICKMSSIFSNIDSTIIEQIDWAKLVANDSEIEKITRLAAALQYVECPNDKDVIENLEENIAVNNIGNGRRK